MKKHLFFALPFVIAMFIASDCGQSIAEENGRYTMQTRSIVTGGEVNAFADIDGYTIVTNLPDGKQYIYAAALVYNSSDTAMEIDRNASGVLFGTSDGEMLEATILPVTEISTETISSKGYAAICFGALFDQPIGDDIRAAIAVALNDGVDLYTQLGTFGMSDVYADGDDVIVSFDNSQLKENHTYEVITVAFDMSVEPGRFLWVDSFAYSLDDGPLQARIEDYEKPLLFGTSGKTVFACTVCEKKTGI